MFWCSILIIRSRFLPILKFNSAIMKSYAIIMAGGVGARFWPYGSTKMPKQFLPIANSSDTMLQLTIKRIKDIIPHDRIFIITNCQYINEVKRQVPKIPLENIIGEPVGRNT